MSNMTVKSRDEQALAAIQKFLEDGGRVKLRGADHKKVRANYKFGSRGRCTAQLVTVGFNPKVLTDSGIRARGVEIKRNPKR